MSSVPLKPVADAYRKMAELGYRPMAPSDGFGNITGHLNLRREMVDFVEAWWKQERSGTFLIGTPELRELEAMVYFVEAARMCCSGSTEWGLALAELGVEEFRRIIADPGYAPTPFGPPRPVKS